MEYKLTFATWREGIKAGRLLGLKCKDCGTVTCPPRKVCAGCAGENLDVIELGGKGEIRSFTVCYAVPTGFVGPYVVAVADLEEGGRVMGDVLDIDQLKQEWSLWVAVQVGFKRYRFYVRPGYAIGVNSKTLN
jgi:uncharacterized OB-fold protein